MIATRHICPICKSDKITLWMGGYTGAMYRCPDCGYVGPVVIETSDDLASATSNSDEEEE